MEKKKKSLKRKVVEAGGWQVAKRVAKSVPVVGGILTIGLVGYDIKKKGVIKGVLNSGLDAIPIIGTAKNVVEFFTGDWLSDKEEKKDLYQREEFQALEKNEKE
jgi:hypothetical protein